MRTLPCALLIGLLSAACGGSGDTEALSVTFSLSRGGDPVACADVDEVMEVEARLRPTAGGALLGPTDADCGTGRYDASVPAGAYSLEMTARGLLSGDASAVLFRAREDIDVPGAATMVLQPQVAFLELSWTFGEDALAPCGTEVDSVDVIVSTGAGAEGTFRRTYGCADTPVRLEAPLDLREYTISLTANSAEGFPLFTHQAERLLDRGLNSYLANLAPLGGQVFVDWDFVTSAGETPLRACDSEQVEVETALVTIESLEGGATVSETVDCTARPFAFSAARFTEGRRLRLSVVASGAARFVGREEFVMPGGDRMSDRLLLHARGDASVDIKVVTASCAPGMNDGVQMTLSLEGEDEPLREVMVDDATMSTVLEDLWYGTYTLEASLLTAGGPLCPRRETKVLQSPTADWGTLSF